ncbi:MAG: hypothetical protein IPM55_15805 [Acidobacteria bacterium]|nr:hypothetical protein [Acidobacteriota bacterium]
MLRRIGSIILLVILTALPAAAMVGQFCHYESGMDCCIDETGCPMPMSESDSSMATGEGCLQMCACTLERRESPVSSTAESRQIVSDSAAQGLIGTLFGSALDRQLNHIRPPLIRNGGDIYLQINCFRI